VALHIVLRLPDLSYFCFDSYPWMEYGTSRNWMAARQLGPRVPIVGACHVSHMRGAWPNVLSGASDTRRDPTDTGKASGSERMRGHTRRGCSQRPRVRPSSGYGAAQAATCARQRRCAPAPPPPHRTAVAVAYNSAHRHGRHNPHPSPSEAYPYLKL